MAHEFNRWPTAATVDTLPPVHDLLPAVLDRIKAPRRRRATRTQPRAG